MGMQSGVALAKRAHAGISAVFSTVPFRRNLMITRDSACIPGQGTK